jgi:hypothetical protein
MTKELIMTAIPRLPDKVMTDGTLDSLDEFKKLPCDAQKTISDLIGKLGDWYKKKGFTPSGDTINIYKNASKDDKNFLISSLDSVLKTASEHGYDEVNHGYLLKQNLNGQLKTAKACGI